MREAQIYIKKRETMTLSWGGGVLFLNWGGLYPPRECMKISMACMDL